LLEHRRTDYSLLASCRRRFPLPSTLRFPLRSGLDGEVSPESTRSCPIVSITHSRFLHSPFGASSAARTSCLRSLRSELSRESQHLPRESILAGCRFYACGKCVQQFTSKPQPPTGESCRKKPGLARQQPKGHPESPKHR
jgi:hypothetical protein